MKRNIKKTIAAFLILGFLSNVVLPLREAAAMTGPWWGGSQGGNIIINPPPPPPNGFVDNPNKQCALGDPVFLHNGDFFYQHKDVAISSRSMPTEVTRIYKSQSRYNNRFGYGWDISCNKKIVPLCNGDLFYLNGELNRYRFSYVDGTSYISPKGVDDTIVQNTDGSYTLKEKQGTTYEFDQNGVLTETRDRNANSLHFTYDPNAKLPIIGKSIFSNDPNPKVIAYDYKLIKITDTVGREINLNYNAEGQLQSIVDFAGRTHTYAYDASGNGDLISYTAPATADYPLGLITTYGYDTAHNLVTLTDARGQLYLTNTYNSQDRLITQVSGTATTHYSYDIQNRITIRTDANGNAWTYYFDEQGNIIKSIDPQGNTTLHSYDPNKTTLLTQSTDSQGNSTSYEYDTNGNLIKITDPQGHITVFTYDLTLNKILTSTDALGRTTAYEYDTNGNLTKLTDTLGNITHYTYDTHGQLTAVTDARENTTTYTYDSFGNLISITDPQTHQTTFAYDLLGRRISVTDPRGAITRYSYSASGCTQGCISGQDKISKIIYPDETTEEFSYDALGNLTKRKDANGKETLYEYDLHSRLTKVTDSLGNITQYTYDNLGNLLTLTDAENHTTTNTYDSLGRLIRVTDALGYLTQYSYDSNDNLIQKIDAKGQVTEYEYDSLNQLNKVYYGGKASPVKTVSFTYDLLGNMLFWNDGTYSATYSYDGLNRVSSLATTYPFATKTISYTYDQVGNKKTFTDAQAGVNTYTYDSLNRLTQILSPASQATSYEYDTASRLTKKTLPNGVYTEYNYDNMNRLLSLGNKRADNSVISSFSYTHDNVGNGLSMTTSEGTHNYTYDNTYRLTSATHPAQPAESFTYDKVGNRKTSSQYSDWAYDANNRLLSYNGFSFTYDNNGNTLTKTQAANTTTYSYDYENRLSEGIVPERGLSLSYTYDPFSKRLSKTVNSTTTYYLYDNEDIIAEYDSTGALIASYLHGQGIDEPISMTRGGSTYYYTFDGLGSVTELTDSTGAAVESYKYDAFGKLTTPPTTGNPYTYTGREYDTESGLYFYRARYYDAGVGRFITADPIGVESEINLYIYVDNNPANFGDPYGLQRHSISNYGNWCGAGWSGGKRVSPCQIGSLSVAAADSLDECCKGHDKCLYDVLHAKPPDPCEMKKKARKCDRDLCRCLLGLSGNSKKWPKPPPKNAYSEGYTTPEGYRNDAIAVFCTPIRYLIH